jgi:outer membrane protein W
MNRTMRSITRLGFLLTLCAASHAAAAEDGRWQVEITGLSSQSTTGWIWGDSDESAGGGLALEYRASRRLGLALEVLSSKVESDVGFEFFDTDLFVLASSVRMTPVLARLDVHLTPDHKADLVVGPVVGYMHYGDLTTEIRSDFLGEDLEVERLRTKDGLAWGAHIGLDVPIGAGGLYFTTSATYLAAEVETEGIADEAAGGTGDLDLDPFVVQAGFGYRF